MWFAKLMAHLQPRVEPITVDGVDDEKLTIVADNDEIGPIKALLFGQLKEKYFLKPFHVAATYLDPLQKNHLLDCSFIQELIDHGLLYFKDIMCKVGPPKQMAVSKSGDKCPLSAKKNCAKKPRTVFVHAGPSRDDNDDDSLKSDEDHEQGEAAQLEALIEHELASYRLLKANNNNKKVLLHEDTRKRARLDGEVKHDIDLLPWWKIKSANFPILARATRAILCISASSSMLECTFSSLGNTQTNKCNALKPTMLNAYLYLRSNQDLDRSQ
jgi:hypothetical protein